MESERERNEDDEGKKNHRAKRGIEFFLSLFFPPLSLSHPLPTRYSSSSFCTVWSSLGARSARS